MERNFEPIAGLKIIFCVLIAVVLLSTGVAKAGNTVALNGYAWSPNIGWIRFNCVDVPNKCSDSDYKVNWDDVSGNLSGYAWSDNIGWISFEDNDTANCPQSSCQPRLDKDTGIMSGWARAVAACQDDLWDGTHCTGGGSGNKAGGWNGWVNLNCASTPGLCATSDYKGQVVPAPASGGVDFTNWIFGRGDVLGWITLNCLNKGTCGVTNNHKVSLTPTSPPVINTFTAEPNAPNPPPRTPCTYILGVPCTIQINNNTSATLRWSTTNALSCVGTNFSTGAGNPTSGSVSTGNLTVPPSSRSYTLTCTGLGGTANATVNVNIIYEFTLSSSPGTIDATIVGGASAKSSPATTIRVNPIGGFSETITLTASSGLPAGTQYVFSPRDLAQGEYSTGSQFYVIIPPGGNLAGSYLITIQGAGGGIIRTTTVTLNATEKSPVFKEE